VIPVCCNQQIGELVDVSKESEVSPLQPILLIHLSDYSHLSFQNTLQNISASSKKSKSSMVEESTVVDELVVVEEAACLSKT
jgi:hypothetical protein